MNWLKRRIEIRRLKKLEREKFWEMVRFGTLAQDSDDDALVSKALELEREVDDLRARIAELRGDAESKEMYDERARRTAEE